MSTCICILGTVVSTAHFWHSCSPCPNAAVHLHAVGVGPAPTRLRIPCAIAPASGARLYLEPAVGIVLALPRCHCTSQVLCPHPVGHPMHNCICIQSTVVSRTCGWHSFCPAPCTAVALPPSGCARNCVCIPSTIVSIRRFWHTC